MYVCWLSHVGVNRGIRSREKEVKEWTSDCRLPTPDGLFSFNKHHATFWKDCWHRIDRVCQARRRDDIVGGVHSSHSSAQVATKHAFMNDSDRKPLLSGFIGLAHPCCLHREPKVDIAS